MIWEGFEVFEKIFSHLKSNYLYKKFFLKKKFIFIFMSFKAIWTLLKVIIVNSIATERN